MRMVQGRGRRVEGKEGKEVEGRRQPNLGK